ncbi:hypothetical protein GCM10010335_23160 [Streptomyces galbus]|nr:hypothetical protein GCM10010335_23160 [Streptomyces galbus]
MWGAAALGKAWERFHGVSRSVESGCWTVKDARNNARTRAPTNARAPGAAARAAPGAPGRVGGCDSPSLEEAQLLR